MRLWIIVILAVLIGYVLRGYFPQLANALPFLK